MAGSIIAPPSACTVRAPTRNGTDGAAAHAADAAANVSSPAMKTRLRPTRSAMRPVGTSRAANTIA